jgi:Outer membrane protein beta-barrel domain
MQRKLILTLLTAVSITALSAQDLRLNLFGGMANYNGDLQSRPITFQQARYSVGLWASYDINPYVMLRGGLHFAEVRAEDRFQKNPANRLRNLSFATNIIELHAAAEYHFLGMTDRVFSPYVFGGLAGFHYNPYAYDQAGNKVSLKPLSTEGQGLAGYPDRQPYSLVQFAVPLGVGVRMVLTDRIDVGAEFGYRKTFTDYMDDVSRSYVDQAVLLASRGPKAVEMAFRTPEVPGHSFDPYPVDLEKRGGSEYKDNYYFLGLTFTYRLTGGDRSGGRSSGGRSGGKRRSSLGCPTNVF